MKKLITTCLLVFVFVAGGLSSPVGLVAQENGVYPKGCGFCTLTLSYQISNTIYWKNGVEKGPMESAPMIKHDRTFILIRYVADELPDVSIAWDGVERKVTVETEAGKIIELWIDNPTAKVDGIETQIDENNPAVMPFIEDGRTKLPFRFIGEMLGASDIKWHGDTKTVDLIFQLDENCEWTEIGKIISKAPQDNGSMVITFSENCDDNSQTLIIPDFNMKAVNADEFENAELFTIGRYQSECVRFCLDENNNVVLWEAYPDGDCCPEIVEEICCDWSTIQVHGFPSLCPGEEGTTTFTVENTCEKDSEPIDFVVTTNDNVEISETSFSLTGDQMKEINVTFTMPEDCKDGTLINYKVLVSASCDDKPQEIPVLATCMDCEDCCNFETKLDNVPDSVCPGEEFSVVITTYNNCENDELTFKIEALKGMDEKFVFEDDDHLEFTLDPKRGTDRYIDCIMPENCEEDEEIEFMLKVTAFDSDGEECGSEIVSFTVECENCVVCCDFSIEYGRIPPPVCAGEIFQVGLYLRNTCDDTDLTFKLKQDPSSENKPGFGKIIQVKPAEVTVDADRTEMIKTLCEMPDSCTDGAKYTYKVLIEACNEKGEKCGSKTIEFKVECKDCSDCCDFDYSIGELTDQFCPGEEFSVNMNVTNNCEKKALTFQFAVGGSSNITEILPGSFSLDPQSSRSVKIDCVMPSECQANQKVTFTFTMIALDDTGAECERKVISFSFYCDDCTCCEISMKPFKVNINKACAGDTGIYVMSVKNNCENQTKNIQFIWSRTSGISAISPNKLTLKPGETKTITLSYTMPKCKVGSAIKFYFTTSVNDCEQLTKYFTIYCKDCVCCEVQAISQRVPKSIEAGASSVATYYIKNNCNKTVTVTLSPVSNITYIKPTTLTLKAGEKNPITLGLKMPTRKGTFVLKYALFKFKMKISGCKDQEVSFKINYK